MDDRSDRPLESVLMSVRDALLKRLATSQNAAVENAVEAALSQALPHEQQDLAQVLLERNRRPGWIALVRAFHKLPEELQNHLLHQPKDLFGPLSDTMEDDEGNGRMNVIEIVRKAADPKLTFLLTEALSDVRPEVRSHAAHAILELILCYYRQAHCISAAARFNGGTRDQRHRAQCTIRFHAAANPIRDRSRSSPQGGGLRPAAI